MFIVTSFYGTHVMNVADWKGAYCLFPKLTLVEEEMCLFSVKKRRELLAFDKYVARGLVPDSVQGSQKEELTGVRHVGDSFSRKLCFSDVEVASKDVWEPRLEDFRFRFDGKRMVETVWTRKAKAKNGESETVNK